MLNAATPASMRPSRGNVVVSVYDCLSFPHGIMARVLFVSGADGGGFRYVCEKARLEDVYDRLVICEKYWYSRGYGHSVRAVSSFTVKDESR